MRGLQRAVLICMPSTPDRGIDSTIRLAHSTWLPRSSSGSRVFVYKPLTVSVLLKGDDQ